MRRFISMLMLVLVVAATSALSAAPVFADDTNNAGENNVICYFPDTDTTSVVDADVCVSTGGIIVDVL